MLLRLRFFNLTLFYRYEEEMQSLWKQRDDLIKENTDYEIKNQLLDEELRLVKKYKESLEKEELKIKAELQIQTASVKQKEDAIVKLKEEVAKLKDENKTLSNSLGKLFYYLV